MGEQMKGADDVVIKTDEDLDRAVLIHQRIKKIAKMVKEKKEALTKPLNAALKSWRDQFRPLEEEIESAESKFEQKILEYRRKRDEKASKKEEEIADKVASGELSAEKGVEKMEGIKRAEITGSHVRRVLTLEIFDEALLPREYLVPDSVKIKEALKAGIEVAGARMVDKEILV